jgi:hypothetical protein
VISRRVLEDRLASRNVQIEVLTAERDSYKTDAEACGRQIIRAHADLSRAKDVIAAHIAGAGHPDTALQDVRAFALSLQQSLAAAGIDLRLEFARLEGARL